MEELDLKRLKEIEIEDTRTKIISELKELEQDEKIKRYLQLKEDNERLYEEQKELIKEIKLAEYDSCNHIWITTKIDRDTFEGRSESFCGCIKCGLNQEVFEKVHYPFYETFLSLEDQLMYNHMRSKRGYKTGDIIQDRCDFSLAKSIYSRIKEKYPDIDNKTAIRYFEYALNGIRNTKVSEERKENRAKRLSLSPKFNKWNRYDI